jgi:hypothetical protein
MREHKEMWGGPITSLCCGGGRATHTDADHVSDGRAAGAGRGQAALRKARSRPRWLPALLILLMLAGCAATGAGNPSYNPYSSRPRGGPDF